ncbi:LuxR C-terminal-related transcriptional regulator [Klebsiella michiganensis]|uniref:helix-turn-helix transcriptional regulator n=1 Tax=Klebsiella michiganensis TaxID=1134687 RepID=UPI00256FFE42|nr:LuxR C-terminal-related transcriptional regulator [Klebsiella michiganensis]MDL4454777.1 LuxR C-terminal-related transcriptional regulator [Klebsiella michiganensis]
MSAAKNTVRATLSPGVTVYPSRRLQVIVLEPVALYRDCLMRVLKARFGRAVNILGVAQSLSGARRMLMQFERVDALIGAPYGTHETLRDWEHFGRLRRRHYPGLACLMWTTLPLSFVRLFTPPGCRPATLLLGKKVPVTAFCQAVEHVLAGHRPGDLIPRAASGDAVSPPALTQREVLILSELMQGKHPRQIAQRYGNSLKTISSHKRRAMQKLGVTSNVQLMAALQALAAFWLQADNGGMRA